MHKDPAILNELTFLGPGGKRKREEDFFIFLNFILVLFHYFSVSHCLKMTIVSENQLGVNPVDHSVSRRLPGVIRRSFHGDKTLQNNKTFRLYCGSCSFRRFQALKELLPTGIR